MGDAKASETLFFLVGLRMQMNSGEHGKPLQVCSPPGTARAGATACGVGLCPGSPTVLLASLKVVHTPVVLLEAAKWSAWGLLIMWKLRPPGEIRDVQSQMHHFHAMSLHVTTSVLTESWLWCRRVVTPSGSLQLSSLPNVSGG